MLVCGLFSVDAQSQQAAPATTASAVKTFITRPVFSQVTLSPDGNSLAALMAVPDNPYKNLLVMIDPQTGKVVHATPAGENAAIFSYEWVSNTRLLAALQAKFGGFDHPRTSGALFAINANGWGQKIVFGSDGRAAAVTIGSEPLDNGHVLISARYFTNDRAFTGGAYPQAGILNVDTGSVSSLGGSPIRNAQFIADHAGQVRVAYADNHYSGGEIWMRANNDAPWMQSNVATKSGMVMAPVGFNRDNTKLYVRISRGRQPDAIALLDMGTGQFTTLYQGKFADPGALLRTADQKDYYAVITMDGKPGLFYFDENCPEARMNQALAANFPDQLAYFSSFSRDGSLGVLQVLSDRNPGDFFLFNFKTHNARYLFSAKPSIDPRQMHSMQVVEVTARDGLTLHGFLTLPSGNKPYPLIVLPHGGPYQDADIWGFNDEAQLFASRGYAVLQVNFRGSPGYGNQFITLGYRQWGGTMQDDLTDATQWAIREGYTDPKRICMYGGSYGGFAALEGAVREPELYKCAIGYSGVYDLRVQLDESDTQSTDMGTEYLARVLGTDRDDLLRRSPLSGVDRIKADLLLIHGGVDRRAPIKNFNEFAEALRNAGKHYESLVDSEEGHGFFLPEHQIEAYTKMLDFLDRNIGSDKERAQAASTSMSP
jgi:dienelactone hydrolase